MSKEEFEEYMEELFNPSNQESLGLLYVEQWRLDSNGNWVLLSQEPYGVMDINNKVYIKTKQR